MPARTRCLAPLAAFLVLLLGAPSSAEIVVGTVYKEIFPINDVPDVDPGDRKGIVFAQKWYGEQHGSAIVDAASQDLQRLDPGNTEMEPVESMPVGSFPPSGGAFYSPSARAGIFIFTDEFEVDSEDLVEVRFDTRNSGCSLFIQNNSSNCQKRFRPDGSLNFDPAAQSDMHLALRIGTTWYISDQSVDQSAYNDGQGLDPVWQTQSFVLDQLTFMIHDRYEPGECQPTQPNCLPRERQPEVSGVPLPEGEIDAFGVWIAKNQPAPRLNASPSATQRIDNFELRARVRIPASSPLGVALLALALLGATTVLTRRHVAARA